MEHERSELKSAINSLKEAAEPKQPMFPELLSRLEKQIKDYDGMTFDVLTKLSNISRHNYDGENIKNESESEAPDTAAERWNGCLNKLSFINDRMRMIREHLDTIV